MKAQIDFFTGTGNSANAVGILKKELEKKKYSVNIREVTIDTAHDLPLIDLYVVIFPVYALTVPHIFYRHLKNLPDGNNVKTIIIANYGMINMKGGINTGYEGPSLNKAYKKLKSKNFNVVLTETVGYPENITIISSAVPKKDQAEIISAGDEKIIKISKMIFSGESKIKKYKFIEKFYSGLFSYLFLLFGRMHFGKFFIADKKCTSCGRCIKLCPKNTIRMFRKKPRWNYRCEGCLRCFNICPENSIQISIVRLALILILSIIPVFFIVGIINYFMLILSPILPSLFYDTDLINIPLRIFIGIIIYFIIYYPALFIFEKFLLFAEQIKVLRPFFELTYTSNFKRYFNNEFFKIKK